MNDAARTLRSGFIGSASRFPNRPAIQLGGKVLTYSELFQLAARIAATLDAAATNAEPPLTAVLGQRSITAYAGVLAALFRGHGYVPLNPSFPTDRTRAMLVRSECRSLIVEASALPLLEEVLAGVAAGLLILVPDLRDTADIAARWPQHRVLGELDLLDAGVWKRQPVDPNGIAYLLFTSGSTGIPKGVMVAHRNVTHFIDAMVDRYSVTEADRFSQTFDLTFDLSVFDMFVAWECGACLCCPTQSEKTLPGKYVSDSALTVWFSVPSTAVLMARLRLLKPDRFSQLRLSLFCGEALPIEVIQKWAAAAPNSLCENLYGPTELTIACTLYRWDAALSPSESELGVVPIGEPYPGMKVLVADEQQREVAEGETGELLMTGPQLSLGYYKDPERTAVAFMVPPGRNEVYYRTGDRVRRPKDGKPLTYLGRMDNQIKIQGYRVELGEIEEILRQEAGVDVAIAIGWPVTSSGADGVVGFLGTSEADIAAIRARVVARLPPYMHPSQLKLMPEFPLNSNGKVDRKALAQIMADDAAGASA